MARKKLMTAVVKKLREVSKLAANLGIDLTKAGEARLLVLLHDLELKPIRKFQHGSAVDASGAKLEIRCALEGGTCQLGRFYRDNAVFKRIAACDYVLCVWFYRVDPLRVASAYKVPADKVLALADSAVIANCSVSEKWAATNGTSVLGGFLRLTLRKRKIIRKNNSSRGTQKKRG
jgi:hypothetical protein